jgi:hypothetical protein
MKAGKDERRNAEHSNLDSRELEQGREKGKSCSREWAVL